jgi:hypothetical protein
VYSSGKIPSITRNYLAYTPPRVAQNASFYTIDTLKKRFPFFLVCQLVASSACGQVNHIHCGECDRKTATDAIKWSCILCNSLRAYKVVMYVYARFFARATPLPLRDCMHARGVRGSSRADYARFALLRHSLGDTTRAFPLFRSPDGGRRRGT